MRLTVGDLVVELYGQRLGVLRGDWRTFDLVPDPAAALHFGLDSTVLSIAVPPQARSSRSRAPTRRSFFAELLPEGRMRTRLAQTVGGYRYLHHAIDDHSRLAYSEILEDQTKESAAAFWRRAAAYLASVGVRVQAVMTDNGACYRSQAFNKALGQTVKHRCTRPYRPQTNGKVERFNRTLMSEWAYARSWTSETQRETAYQDWLHSYNHHRPRTALDGLTPASRVHNLTGNYT